MLRYTELSMQESMTNAFFAELKNVLAEAEPYLLELELAEGDAGPEVVGRLFRVAHAIRGSAGLMGQEAVASIAYCVETVLECINSDVFSCSEKTGRLILKAFSALDALLDSQADSFEGLAGNAVPENAAAVCDSLWQLVRDNLDEPEMLERKLTALLPGGQTLFSVSAFDLERSRLDGTYLYVMEFNLPRDIYGRESTPLSMLAYLQKSGHVLDTHIGDDFISLTATDQTDDANLYVLYTTILEPDLMNAVFQVEPWQIHRIMPEDILAGKPVWEGDPSAAGKENETELTLEPVAQTIEGVDDLVAQFDLAMSELRQEKPPFEPWVDEDAEANATPVDVAAGVEDLFESLYAASHNGDDGSVSDASVSVEDFLEQSVEAPALNDDISFSDAEGHASSDTEGHASVEFAHLQNEDAAFAEQGDDYSVSIGSADYAEPDDASETGSSAQLDADIFRDGDVEDASAFGVDTAAPDLSDTEGAETLAQATYVELETIDSTLGQNVSDSQPETQPDQDTTDIAFSAGAEEDSTWHLGDETSTEVREMTNVSNDSTGSTDSAGSAASTDVTGDSAANNSQLDSDSEFDSMSFSEEDIENLDLELMGGAMAEMPELSSVHKVPYTGPLTDEALEAAFDAALGHSGRLPEEAESDMIDAWNKAWAESQAESQAKTTAESAVKGNAEIQPVHDESVFLDQDDTSWEALPDEALSDEANVENANVENANVENANVENANVENANVENAMNFTDGDSALSGVEDAVSMGETYMDDADLFEDSGELPDLSYLDERGEDSSVDGGITLQLEAEEGEILHGFTIFPFPPEVVIRLEGDLTIGSILPLKDALLDLMQEYSDVKIDMSGVESADLTFVQVLTAAVRTAEARGVSIGLSEPPSEAVTDVLSICGLDSSTMKRFRLRRVFVQ